MKRYLGVVPQSDATGCLEDGHWSNATFRYFPIYCSEASSLPSATPRWRQNSGRSRWPLRFGVRSHRDVAPRGSPPACYSTDQLIRNAMGEPFSATSFFDYVGEKYPRLYDL